MVQLPEKFKNLPDRDELEYKEKEFMLGLYEDYQATNKKWLVGLLAILVLAIPVAFGLSSLLTNIFVGSYQPPEVNTDIYNPENLTIRQQEVLPFGENRYSAYIQIVNPNPEISAWDIEYKLTFFDSAGNEQKQIQGDSFILAGQSKFIVEPLVRSEAKLSRMEVEFERIRWTDREPKFDITLTLSGIGQGLTSEENYYVEATVKNQQGYRIKKVPVAVLLFDQTQKNIIAVNKTEFTDLEAQEARYFRVLWPENIENADRAEVIPQVNPLDPDLVLDIEEQIPSR